MDLRGIISPLASSPARVDPGGLLQAIIRLRLPLTPPPGVQQPAARKGWQASLKRRDTFAKKGESTVIEYTAEVIRIRPNVSKTYRISIELKPWIPGGLYDLSIVGPGFSAEQSGAVMIGKHSSNSRTSGIDITREGINTIEVLNRNPEVYPWTFDLIVPADSPGLVVKMGKQRLKPKSAVWAEIPHPGKATRRLLHFEVNLPGTGTSGSKKQTIAWSDVKAGNCRAQVIWDKVQDVIDPMAWIDLEMATGSFDPTSIIWNFGDGKSDFGTKVRHRFILSNIAEVKAAAFDSFGRVCQVSASSRLNLPLERSGCECSHVNSPGTSQFSLFNIIVGK
ncbi:MAG: hypothetical protein GY847_06685 [Proteobacteria bacterium]|nr:hypothetical protein [Pseudomonadota bacterium]